MSEWFYSVDGDAVCDVASGTGKPILTYLDFIENKKAQNLLHDGKVYLYEVDEVALYICKIAILLKYGKQFKNKIYCIAGDFLSAKINLPKNCKVISNRTRP